MNCKDRCARPARAEARGTKWVAGAPYHWHELGDVLYLVRGYAPEEAPANPSEAYRRWAGLDRTKTRGGA